MASFPVYEIALEQVAVFCAVALYHWLLCLCETTLARERTRISRQNGSTFGTWFKKLCVNPKLTLIWFALACLALVHRIVARMQFEHCSSSMFKTVISMLNPGTCAQYNMYMMYVQSIGGFIGFGMIASIWRAMGIDPNNVFDAHKSIKILRDMHVDRHPVEVQPPPGNHRY